MKKIWIFSGGIVTGMVLMFVILLIIGKCSTNNNMTYFDKPGKCIEGDAIEVFQVLPNGDALAWMQKAETVGGETTYIDTNVTVLLPCSEGRAFYDNELIKIPKDMCAKQIGVYNYPNKDGHILTVPIVDLHKK